MRLRGIHYDVGIDSLAGGLTRPELAAGEVTRDLELIAGGLHANAIRLSGRDPQRLAIVGEVAAARALEVWLSPFLVNGSEADTLALTTEVADVAEQLRSAGASVVLVVGCEASVFMSGILPGASPLERLRLLSDP